MVLSRSGRRAPFLRRQNNHGHFDDCRTDYFRHINISHVWSRDCSDDASDYNLVGHRRSPRYFYDKKLQQTFKKRSAEKYRALDGSQTNRIPKQKKSCDHVEIIGLHLFNKPNLISQRQLTHLCHKIQNHSFHRSVLHQVLHQLIKLSA